jgi:predicted nuclease of predicted toxin-antitoxin system
LGGQNIRFLGDESCDFIVVRTLRTAGYDVVCVSEKFPSASDGQVIKLAANEKRVIITEDKDFGEWVFAHREENHGVLLIRFPANMRSKLGEAVSHLVTEHGSDLVQSFTVLEPGRARIRKQTRANT